MKKIRFLFYSGDGVFKNDHIFKEHGAIIDHFNRQGFDAKMVCIDHGQKIDAADKLDKNVPIKYIENQDMLGGISLGMLGYLFSVKKLHTLILTHFSPKTFVYALRYKAFHPTGKIYLKGDFDAERFAGNRNRFIKTNNPIVKFLEKIIVRMFIGLMDLITVETQKGMALLHDYAPYAKKKIAYVTNGYDEEFLKDNNLQARYEDKENVIMTIGRIGTHQKNTEKLLQILAQTNLQSWHAYLIGTIDPAFEITMDMFFQRHPQLREKITFTGPIYDRKELFSYLHKAKVYLCTSRFEGFSLVFPELISQGVSLITTPVSGAHDVGGTVLEHTDDFVKTLQSYISEDIYDKNMFDSIVHRAESTFTREKNMKNLEHLLKEIHHEDHR